MHIDIILDSHLSPNELKELGVLAEENGIRGIWNSSYLDGREPFTNMAALAAATSKIRLGPIALNAYEQHPFRVAMGLLTFNEIAGGRAQTVIGGGGEVVMALGVPFEKRVRVVRECLEMVKGASGERPFTYEGELYQIKDYDPYWATAPAPLVYAAANRPQMLYMSAGIADGIMMSDLSPTLSKGAIDIVMKRLKKVDRDPADFRINNFMAWYVYDDKEEARKEAKRWIGFRAMFRKYMMEEIISDDEFDILIAHMPQIYEMSVRGTDSVEGVPDSLLDVCVDKLTLTGDVNDLDHIIEHLHELKQVGITELSLELRKHVPQSIKLIGERVIPALR